MFKDEMRILGQAIPLASDFVEIHELKFLKDNPRVYACTHGESDFDFDQLLPQQQQEIIFKKLLQEPSVKNLIPEVRRHGGLIEPILIRTDTMEVIEGNSRLAVYRHLQQKNERGDWDLIPCAMVSSLTDDQQAAFLNQIHVKGKTKWSAYEKANFAFVRKAQGWRVERIARLFGESEATIRTRAKVIETMKWNNDNQRSHFSYYDVLVRVPSISTGMKQHEGLSDCLFQKIKNLGSDEDESEFTAQELRKKLPVILKKHKVLKKYIDGKIDLDGGFRSAKINQVEETVKQAKTLLEDISHQEVSRLERNELNALKEAARKLSREVERIKTMIGKMLERVNSND